ncbi:peptide chain release factor N(5)-glutamine methyltransferase [Fusibacter tunisiensis]|jgi:release factor glutamine methyltransferase|uniref:Release factor glutamine methyltransferase n=1 Tax=Fusibacter tunisiensis TaxID=1008308 RepID=A0ABS2MPP3_9FIRM|nr:peptide chain release factor N(5)-glutamine methyltransferase [Fusibacter tunisiensis]MBM7561287.1 release factor glutamine methyltransferase [Fusibacter tunisiensis]
MIIKALHQQVEFQLKHVTESWQFEAKTLLCHFLKLSFLDLIFNGKEEVAKTDIEAIESAVRRRLEGEPLQYILGTQAFMGLTFVVTHSVLIPRPETEVLVAWVIDQIKPSDTVLDVGTGSGAIAISIAKKSPVQKVYAVDISEKALEVARLNADRLEVSSQIEFYQGDLLEPIEEKTFDLIVSNPPYIPEKDAEILMREVVAHEPGLALFGGVDGLDFYRRLIPEALKCLKPGGLLVFEAGHDQSDQIVKMMLLSGYVDVGTFKDLCDIPRFIYGKKT